MKKRGLTVFALAAVLAAGTATITSQAAEGWSKQNDTWVYYDSQGYIVRDEWKKGADNQWRYLNGSGVMAVNEWVDDTYYVNGDGLMIANSWLRIAGDDEDAVDGYLWYYFDSSGKVETDGWKKIDGNWYYFDDDGVMQTGWVDDNTYYCDAGGKMLTGWQLLLSPDDEEYNDGKIRPGDEDDDGKVWYYFSANGKKYTPDVSGDECDVHKIGDDYYCFNGDGEMQTGWVNMKDSQNAGSSIADYSYFGPDGRAKKGWLALYPPDELSGYDGVVEWFYFSSKGEPEVGPAKGEASVSDLVKINGETYLFNDLGNPVYGLQKVYVGGSSEEYTSYAFGTNRANCMMTKGEKVRLEEEDGTVSEFYFSNSGQGFTGVRNGYLYYLGKLQKLDSGMKYDVVSIPDGEGWNNYVVSSSGKVMRSTTVKNADGIKYTTNSSGILTEIDGEKAGDGHYEDPVEPAYYD
ncbi:MAG TPA: cell wall-binding protein [Candidatus Lachnoclostridium avicola]|nr:cell wall-binding protein [Candidatus Lachnoclostridium avicola]